MKKLMLVSVGFLVLAACAPADGERAVRDAIAAANHCVESSDCVVVTAVCPFDCYVPAHKDEAAALEARFASYETDCAYSCTPMPGVQCAEGACVLDPVALPEGN